MTHLSHHICRYIVKDVLGHGTFGQVAKCLVAETNSFVALKIIKNQPAYYQQALVEVSILTTVIKKLFNSLWHTLAVICIDISLFTPRFPIPVKQEV